MTTRRTFPYPSVRLSLLIATLTSLAAIGFLLHSAETGKGWWLGTMWAGITLGNIVGVFQAQKRNREPDANHQVQPIAGKPVSG